MTNIVRRRFCGVCGEKLVLNPVLKGFPEMFDPATGRPAKNRITNSGYLICPSGKCGHWGIDHDYSYKGFGILGSEAKAICQRPSCRFIRKIHDGIS